MLMIYLMSAQVADHKLQVGEPLLVAYYVHVRQSLVRTPVDREESASSPRLPSVEAAAGFQN